MNKDLELALKIKATHDGLGDIKATIAELKNAGVETAEWEKSASELDQQLTEAGKNQRLIDLFVALQRESKASAQSLEEAQQKAQRLGKEFSSTEKPTKAQTRAFNEARSAVKRAGDSFQESRQKVQGMRAELKTAGIDTKELATAQVRLNNTTAQLKAATTTLDNKLKTHSQSVSELRQRLDAAAEETQQLNTAQQKNQATTNQLKTATVGYENALSRGIRKANEATAANNKQASSHRRISTGVQSISTQLDALKRQAIAVFGVTQGTQLIDDLGKLADEYTNLSSRLELAVGEGKAFNQGMEDIRTTANDAGGSLSAIGDLYISLNRSTKELGTSQKEVAELTDAISKSFVISGTSTQAANAALTQLNQGLQSGVLRGDEFNSVMEQSPRLAQAMTDSLGKTRGELRAMAEDGQLTTEIVVNALQSQAAAIQEEFEQMPDTIGRAAQRMKNEFLIAIGEMDKAGGISESVAAAFSSIAANMDDVINTLQLAGEVATAALIRKYVPAVIASSKAMLEAARSGAIFNGSLATTGRSAGLAATGLNLLKGSLPILAITTLIHVMGKVNAEFNEIEASVERLNKVNDRLHDSNIQLRDRFAEISAKTGVVVTSMAELDEALRSGKIVIDEQTNSYVSAAKALELKALREREATEAAKGMSYTQAELLERYAEVNKQLQVAIDDNSKLASVMSGAVLDALKNGEAGVAAFALGLRSTEQQGKLTQEQINQGLVPALEKLSDEEHARFGDLVKTAMAKVESGAKDAGVRIEYLQDLLDKLKQSAENSALKRLGVSFDEFSKSLTQGTQQASKDLAVLAEKIADMGVTGKEAGAIVETALVNSFKNARNAADRAELTAIMDGFRKAGVLTEQAYKRLSKTLEETGNKAANAADKAAEAWDTATSTITERYERFAKKADDSNKTIEKSTRKVEKAAKDAGDEVDGMADSFGTAAQRAEGLAAGMGEFYNDLRGKLRDIAGDKYVQKFDQQILGSAAAVSEMSGEVDELSRAAAKAKEELSQIQHDLLRAPDFTGVNSAIADAQIAYNSLIIDANNARDANSEVSGSFDKVAESASRVRTGWPRLDPKTLRPIVPELEKVADGAIEVEKAADSAKQALVDMGDQSLSAFERAEDQIDGLLDRQDLVDQRRKERERDELESKKLEASRAGDGAAVKEFEFALRLLDIRDELNKKADEYTNKIAIDREKIRELRKSGSKSDQNKIYKLEKRIEGYRRSLESAQGTAKLRLKQVQDKQYYHRQKLQDDNYRDSLRRGGNNSQSSTQNSSNTITINLRKPNGNETSFRMADQESADNLVKTLRDISERS